LPLNERLVNLSAMELKSKSLAQERFGAYAATYATSRPHAQGGSLARLVELAAPQPAWTALDIATGAGHVALALAPHLSHVVAADLTPQMLGVARGLAGDRNIANISFAVLRAEALPFADATFDLVTCRIAPHHFDDVRKFVTESARVLRPGGRFGLVTICRYLEERRIPTRRGKSRWDNDRVKCLLMNETYAGTRYYNRITAATEEALRKCLQAKRRLPGSSGSVRTAGVRLRAAGECAW